MKYLPLESLVDLGILQEVNREFFHPLGLALEVEIGAREMALRVLDCRRDPAGIVFGEGVMERDKYERFQAFREIRNQGRRRALGFIQQPPANKFAAQTSTKKENKDASH